MDLLEKCLKDGRYLSNFHPFSTETMIMGEEIVAMVHKDLGPLKDGPA